MLTHGVCFTEGCENLGIQLASRLRRQGYPVELCYKTNTKKQFKRLKSLEITCIYTIISNKEVLWYDESFFSVSSTFDELLEFLDWLDDDLDILPDPSDRLLLQNRELPPRFPQ